VFKTNLIEFRFIKVLHVHITRQALGAMHRKAISVEDPNNTSKNQQTDLCYEIIRTVNKFYLNMHSYLLGFTCLYSALYAQHT